MQRTLDVNGAGFEKPGTLDFPRYNIGKKNSFGLARLLGYFRLTYL